MKLTYKLALFSVLPFVILIFLGNTPEINGKAQFVQPLNWGMNMCVPFDIANIFNRPIGAVTGVFLAGFLAVILFFGVITSPFGYMFGIPSRKYVLGGDSNLFPPAAASRSFHESFLSDFLVEEYGNYSDTAAKQEEEYPYENNNFIPVEFSDNAFYLLPKMKDEQCKQLVICMAHGTLRYFPRKLVLLYKLFSRKLTDIPDDYRKAMILGFTKESLCQKEYNKCQMNSLAMVVQTLTGLLPEWTRKKASYNTF